MKGLGAWIAYWRKNGTETQYIPYPATWINGEGWKQVPEEIKTKSAGVTYSPNASKYD